jgi:acyl transferase domain-containing protein/SAM-dependent methyltransferase
MTPDSGLTGLEIAVVGMAGRFPKAGSVDELWERLTGGVECISFFSDEELLAAGADPAALADPSYVKAAGIVDGVELFDAAFFGYSRREAALLDPQQRMFLETAWTALEHAGYAPGTFDGAVGVYGGVGASDYFLGHVHPAIAGRRDEMSHVANDKDFLTTRISYKLNLSGPSLVVQTACSTSLVAIHLACQALIAGECDMALAGGVTIRLPQTSGYFFQEGAITSPDGHCRAFSAGAQGCVPGNGGAIVVLKRLADALADDDCIHTVVKGSAINNDGAQKIGYTAPSVDGQARVIRSALRVAGVTADTIGYLEAHGTGTVLGDPIEIQAATQAYRDDTDRAQYCAIGSIKSNLGHLDAGAGVTGFIKAVLAVKHGVVPPTLHFDAPNPQIDLARSPFYVNNRLMPWRGASGVRRAGVSSFGIGGTNAHVILEEPPATTRSAERRTSHELLLLSAKSERALEQSAADLASFLRTHRDASLGDVAFTLRSGRASLAHRRAITCADVDQAIALLGEPGQGRLVSTTQPTPRVVFMFPGQGSQYPGMARELYETEPVFRRHVDAAAAIVAPLAGVDLRELITAEPTRETEARLLDTRVAQPAIFAVSYALAQLLIGWGIQPAAMIGHSIGEYVAACLAGVFSFEDALRIVCERGTLMGSVASGSMVAVALPADELEPMLPRELALAAINAPNLSVVAGSTAAADALVDELRKRGIEVRPLHTSHAFHSSMMEPVLDAFAARVRSVRLSAPAIPYISNVTGMWATPEHATDPIYWATHLRRVVRFSDGLQKILDMPGAVLLEVGPGQTLTSLARRHRRDGHASPIAFATTRRAEERTAGDKVMLDALGGLWTCGVDIDWRRAHPAPGTSTQHPAPSTQHPRRVPLPTYPFQRERFWLEPAVTTATPEASRRSDLAEWFSTPTWERLPRKAAPSVAAHAGAPGTLWVVFADEHGFGGEVARTLRSAGRAVVTVSDGRGYAREARDAFQIRAGAAEDYQRLCADLGMLDRRALHVVHCWSVEPDDAVRRGRAHLQAYQDRGFYSLLFLAQALGAQSWPASSRASVVTTNVHDVIGTEVLCPEKATIAGPCRVIPLEYEGFECQHVDVVLPSAGGTRSSLVDLLIQTFDEPASGTMAIRGDHRWRATLAPVTLPPSDAAPLLKMGGVYLVTGGMGGLGLALARRLWETVRARLVLVGRTLLPPRSEWPRSLTIESIDAAGAVAHLSRVEPDVVNRTAVAPMSEEAGLERTLDRLSAAYALDFLKRCGVDPADPHAFDRDALLVQCGVLRRFERLFRCLLLMLEADGFVMLDGRTVRFTGRVEPVDIGELRRAAAASHPQMTPVFDLLDNCGRELHAAMTGRRPAIELLFGEGHHEIFTRAIESVRDHSHVPLGQELVRELVAHVAAGTHTRPLRILEIGGGEGVLTKSLLPLLAGQDVEYHFTDIGRSFVVNAQRYAAEHGFSFMRFGTLDISRPPADQGFALDRYDIVVAFNVLHATRRVAESLAHARELVAPGGMLVLQESVRPARWVDLVWGLTDGWWAFEDEPLRTTSPLLGLDAWTAQLGDAGFDLVTSAPQASSIRSIADTGIVVGRKPLAADRPSAQENVSRRVDADASLPHRIAALMDLEQSGAEMEVITADVSDAAAMRAAVDRACARFGTIDGVIHAALVLDDGAMQEKTRAVVEGVFAPKVSGTIALKEACEGLDLDFFVMFSSFVSLLGGRGQVDYCAASNFQDAFAHAERSTLARSVVSIDWAAWREIGKAFRVAVGRGASPQDALPDGMSPAEGLDAFMRILASPYSQVIASPQDPAVLIANRQRSVNAAAPPAVVVAAPVYAPADASAEASAAAAPRNETERVIAHIWQEVLGVPRVGIRDNFFDLGGDSVISLQFIAKAKKAGLRFTKGQVFEHQTIAELAAAVASVSETRGSHVDDR